MGFPILGDIIETVGKLAGKAIVDKDKVREIQFKLEELKDRANERFHEQSIGQIEINKEEAKHSSMFVAGWRPGMGWVGVVGMGYTFVLAPFIEFFARLSGYDGVMPMPDTGQLMTLVLGMLGLGAMRSYDKTQDTETKKI